MRFARFLEYQAARAEKGRKADQLSYNILYVMKNGNQDYINVDGLDYLSL